MNRIYKVIWSKIKNQYVVVSELAHSSGKQSRTAKKSLRSRIGALAVCGAIAAFGVYGALPMQQSFAAAPPTATGMTQESGKNNVTIVVEGDMKPTEDGEYKHSEQYMDYQASNEVSNEHINFSVIGGTNGENRQIVITALQSLELEKDANGHDLYINALGDTIYFDGENYRSCADNTVVDRTNGYFPKYKLKYGSQYLDVGSVVIGNADKPTGEYADFNKGPLKSISIDGNYYTVPVVSYTSSDPNDPSIAGDIVNIQQGDENYHLTTTQYFQTNEKHLATNSGQNPEKPDTVYAPDEDGKITIDELDGAGKPTGNQVVISDVASAKDLGKVEEIKEDLKNEDGSHTSVVDAINNLDDKVGDLNYKHDDGSDLNYVTSGDSVTGAIGDLDAAIGNLSGQVTQAEKNHTTLTEGNGIEIIDNGQKDENGNIAKHEYEVSLRNDITLGDKNGNNVHLDGTNGTISATSNINAGSFTSGNVTINKEGSNLVSGLSNTEWNWKDYDDNKYKGSPNAATEAQLSGAMDGAVQYDRVTDDEGNTTIDKENITLNKGGNSVTIHNVAEGKADTDAVNYGQLSKVQNQVNDNSSAINNMGNQINRLGDRIDKVGAGAAALAALHPLDFDPDDKLSFAAGYGNYAGENAVAIGAFYQPNEDTMFSVGGTIGNDENMVNVGVSFKLGQKNHVSNSRVAMAKELISLRDEVAQLKALMAHSGVLPADAQVDTSALFPDVPENHWAYEYVHELAKLGIVEGYPDGNFDGDRMMTRYEFAAIVYRAMQKGVNIDRRMLTEFEPELKLIRVDVVAKDRNGNPTIERVRVNEEAAQQA